MFSCISLVVLTISLWGFRNAAQNGSITSTEGYNKLMVEKELSRVKLLHIWPMPCFDMGCHALTWIIR